MQVATRLRKAILQAAISGQLTEQRAADGDARDLLAAIRREKARRVRAGELKKERPLPPVDEAEVPFALPENWCWARLGDISLKLHYGFTASAAPHGNAKLLRITDIQNNRVMWPNVPFCTVTEKGLTDYGLHNRDIVIARTGGTIGKSYIVRNLDETSVFASYLIRVIPSELVSEEYLKIFMESPLYWQQLEDKSQGTGQPNVNGKALSNLILPLPTISEQHRIVEFVHGITSEIEKLEHDEQKLAVLESEFPERMRAALLQAAMCGELTKRAVGDGDARDLLADIQREKTRLVKEKKLKKEKPLPPVTAEEVPFDIPENWCWVRIGMIGEVVGGGTPKTGEPENWSPATIPWLTPADMAGIKGRMVSHGARNISEAGLAHSSARLMPAGTVLFSSRAPIGYIGIAENELATNQGFKSVVPFHAGMSEYLYYCLMARTKYIQGIASGTTFLEVSGTAVKNVPIPLPPLAEQRRIVARLEELLPLCGELGERG